ncbi:hypothetical protein ACN42_g10220, partial [Penicillium freii]
MNVSLRSSASCAIFKSLRLRPTCASPIGCRSTHVHLVPEAATCLFGRSIRLYVEYQAWCMVGITKPIQTGKSMDRH